MLTRQDVELRLSEYRARYSGKDPFGPCNDLELWHSSLNESERLIMDSVLQERVSDPFWKDFIAMFYEPRSPSK